MGPSSTLQSKSELFWYAQSSALASQIVTLRSNFAVWQDTRSGNPDGRILQYVPRRVGKVRWVPPPRPGCCCPLKREDV